MPPGVDGGEQGNACSSAGDAQQGLLYVQYSRVELVYVWVNSLAYSRPLMYPERLPEIEARARVKLICGRINDFRIVFGTYILYTCNNTVV